MALRDFSQDHSALALNTATLGHNLEGYGRGWSCEQIIDACAQRGLAGIVFWQREVDKNAIAIGQRVRAAGMQVVGLCRTPYIVGSQAGSDDEIKATIDIAADLGTSIVTIVTGGTEPGTKGILESQKRLAQRLSKAADYASKADISLALEPLNPMFGGNRTVLMTARDALNVCNDCGAGNVGLAIDVYHVWWDTTLAETLKQAEGKVLGYHLCDWLEETSHMLLDRGMMGDGIADLKAIRAAVEATGYNGPCEVEVFSTQNWWLKDPANVLDEIVSRFKDC